MILLEFSVSDVDLHLAGSTPVFPEQDPVLHVYTSADLGVMRDGTFGADLEQGVVFSPGDSKRHVLYLPNATRLRESSSLVVGLYAVSSEQGLDFLVPCGTAIVPMTDLRTKTLELTDPHPRVPIVKGSVKLVIHKITRDIQSGVETAPYITPAGSEKEKAWMTKMNDYVMRVLGMFLTPEEDADYGIEPPHYPYARKFRPSHPMLRQIHCPFYQMEMMGRKLPGFAYSWIMPRAEPNEDYFVRLIKGALQLYEVDEKTFLSAVEKQLEEKKPLVCTDFKMVLDVIGGACSLYAQGQLYVPDHVNKYTPGHGAFSASTFIEEVENMNNLRVTHGNDCEDMGQDNAITALTLRNYESWTNPLTLACRRVLRNFLVLLPHGAVSTASASDAEAPKDTKFVAHIFCLLVSFGRIKKMTERTETDPALLGVPENLPAWSELLDVVFCEGTGRVSPILKPEWEWSSHEREWFVQRARTQVVFEKENTQFSSFNILQVPLIAHPKNTCEYNSFYRYLIAAYVPSGQGAKVGDITFVYPEKQQYGVLVHDFVYDAMNPGLVIPETLEEDEKKFIEECLLSVHPVPQLYCRDDDLIRRDLHFLEKVVGLTPWKSGKQCKNFGYFFTLEELRREPLKIKFNGNYEACYKYFGLDNVTAYIELCICTK